MKTNTYNALRLLAGLITILIVVAQQYIPDKRITVLPNSNYPQSIYGIPDENGGSSATWIDENEHHWQCNFSDSHPYSCGYSISLSENDINGLNIEDFEGLYVNLNYQGDGSRIRIHLRNYNPAYDRGDPVRSAKFLSTIIRTASLERGTLVKLSEFSVGEWWIRDYDIPQEHAAPEFSNVVSMGFDFVNHGEHEVKIQQVELVGSWIQKESLYLGIIIFWMVLIFWEGLHRFYRVYRDSRAAQQRIAKLETDYDLLELEKTRYEVKSNTDVLTGILNRAGLQRVVDKVFHTVHDKSNLGILMLDIDYFKNINDQYGHDCGDEILKELTQLIAQNIRQHDAFARWGGEEFVLLCLQIKEESLRMLAEKLRQLIATQVFSEKIKTPITVSIGATQVAPGESFDTALKRADVALYEAKHRGRNCVVFR